MGLTNALAFQQVMELVLKGLPWHICMVYLDDILIYSRSFEDHLSALGEVFTRIGAAGQRLNARKCHLAREQVVFLAHVIPAEGLRPDPKNTVKGKSWPVPRSATEVRAFLLLLQEVCEGFCPASRPPQLSYSCRFNGLQTARRRLSTCGKLSVLNL